MDKLKNYEQLVVSWSKTHNLISKSQISNIGAHIEDSLSISGMLRNSIMDVGSGGGFPGIPLAITNPEKNFYLVESNAKKFSFLLNTTNKLELHNVKIYNKRVEALEVSEFPEDLDVVARALGSTKDIIQLTKAFLDNKNTKLKLMKTEEQMLNENLPKGYVVTKKESIYSKEKDKSRILVTIQTES